MFSKFIDSNALSDLRNIGEEYYLNENSFEYVKKLSPANVAGMILNIGGSNINSEAKSFIKRINDNWFESVTGSLFVKEDNNYVQKY